MKNKGVLFGFAGLLIVAAAGGGWFVLHRGSDPVETAQQLLQKGDVRAAAIQLRNAVRDEPGNAQAHYLLAQTQLAQGDAVAAEKELKSAQGLNWDKVAIAMSLGQAYAAQNKWKEIVAELPAAGGTPDQTARLLVLRAMAQLGLKDLPAAKASLTEAERVAPQDADVRMAGARLAASQSDMDAAKRKADEALAIDAKRADALQFKGQILASGGDQAGALAMMDQAVTAAPAASNARVERANLLVNQGQDAKARADLDAVLATEPRNASALYLSMVLHIRAKDYAAAEKELQILDPVIGRFPRGLYFQALVKAGSGQSEQAVDAARRYAARAAGDPDGVRLLARLEIAAKRPARAAELLEKAVSGGLRDAETLDLLGRAYALDGRRPDAVRTFTQASSLAPSNSEILTRLASSKMQLGDVSGATAALERSLELSPAQPGAGEALVAAALSAGDLPQAQAALDRLRQQAGDTEAVGVLDGMIRLARLDTDGARTQFASVAAKFPNSVAARLNLARVDVLQNRRGDAITLLKELAEKDRTNGQVLTALVQVLVAEKREAEALAAVEAARAAAPDNIAFVAGQADLVARLGDPARALTILDAAKTNGVLAPSLLPELARIQVAAGKPELAKTTFSQLLLANPNNLDARRGQVELLVNTGDTENAVKSLQEGLRLSPGNGGMLTALLAIEQRTKGIDAAVALADRLRADAANMPAAATLKGDVYAGARRFGDAATAYAAEFAKTPSTLLALRLANAQTAAGQNAQAYTQLKAWQAKQPADPDLAQTLASLEISDRKYGDAEKNLQLVLDKRPNDAVALNNLAWVYQTKGDKRARGLAERAYLIAPTPESADTLGWIMVGDNDAARALPLLQQAQAARPADKALIFHLAAALNAVGKRDEAIAKLQPALADGADFSEKPAAQKLLTDMTAGR